MHYVISFESKQFDFGTEEENPINPIKGQSVGDWMFNLLKTDTEELSQVDAEDWGWYSIATYKGNKYLIGYIGLPSETNDEASEIMIQVKKYRSFFESILGKNKLTKNDPFISIVEKHVKSIKDIANFEVVENAIQIVSAGQ